MPNIRSLPSGKYIILEYSACEGCIQCCKVTDGDKKMEEVEYEEEEEEWGDGEGFIN